MNAYFPPFNPTPRILKDALAELAPQVAPHVTPQVADLLRAIAIDTVIVQTPSPQYCGARQAEMPA